MFRQPMLLLLSLMLLVACDSGKPSTDADIQWDLDPMVDGEGSDNDEKPLPDVDGEQDEKDIGDDDPTDQSDQSDQIFPDDDALLSDGSVDEDELTDDGDLLLDLCFEKACGAHGDCSVPGHACAPYLSTEAYACGPDVEDFGYRGEGLCVEVNCAVDADCREDLGYLCVPFGGPLPEFNDASSACLRSLSGAPCAEEGKKVCQFGKDIVITCTDGSWKPYFCEAGWFCEAGECILEVLDGDGELPDVDVVPPAEICDGVDNNENNLTDEGCDTDGDGWCDITMVVYGTPAICPNGLLDCDDEDPDIYPGSTVHQEGVDYDCDNRKEYQATMTLSVDDQLVELCANGTQFSSAEFGIYYGNWAYADTYGGPKLVLESGTNVIGVHGKDTGLAISSFVAVILVNGETIITDGVLPPGDGNEYTPLDDEWDAAAWRYFPEAVPTPNADWCDKWFDDGDWGPAILAGKAGTAPEVYGNLGTDPWWGGACGLTQYERCPTAFESYYTDVEEGNEPKWIWDYNPTQLADAWLRIRIVLP